MFYIEVAKLLIQINNYYDKIKQKCKDYLCEPYREPDLVIEADDQLIDYGLKLFWEREHIEATKGDAEASLAPHNIYGQLPLFGALWLHAVLLEMDGEGYMVTPFSVWIRRWPSPSCCGSISIGSRQKIRKNIWKCCSSLWRLSLSISLPAIWTARRPLWLMKG